MADSDDPCDDVTDSPVEWLGWVKLNKEYRKEEKETIPPSHTRFEHGKANYKPLFLNKTKIHKSENKRVHCF